MAPRAAPPVLRPPAAGDAGAVAALLGQLGYPADASAVAARLARIAAHAEYAAAVAEGEGAVAGIIVMQRGLTIEHDRPFARVLALVVDERMRGRGIGAALVRWGEGWARTQDAYALHLTTALHRADAHAFYARMGFERTGWRFVRRLA